MEENRRVHSKGMPPEECEVFSETENEGKERVRELYVCEHLPDCACVLKASCSCKTPHESKRR